MFFLIFQSPRTPHAMMRYLFFQFFWTKHHHCMGWGGGVGLLHRKNQFSQKLPKLRKLTVYLVEACKGTIDKITENPHCKEGTRFSLHSKVGERSRGQPALHNLRRRALPLSQPENSEQRKIRQRRKRQRRGKRTTPKRTADPPPSPLSV